MRSPLGVVSPNVPSNPASGAPKIGGSAVAALCAAGFSPERRHPQPRARAAQPRAAGLAGPGARTAPSSSGCSRPSRRPGAPRPPRRRLLRGVLVPAARRAATPLDAAWSQPEARLLDPSTPCCCAHPQVAQRALLLRCAAGGAAAACRRRSCSARCKASSSSSRCGRTPPAMRAPSPTASPSPPSAAVTSRAWGARCRRLSSGACRSRREWAAARSVAHACAHRAARAPSLPTPSRCRPRPSPPPPAALGLTPTLALGPRRERAPRRRSLGSWWSPASVGSVEPRRLGWRRRRPPPPSPFSPSAVPARGVSSAAAGGVRRGRAAAAHSGFSVVTRLFSPSPARRASPSPAPAPHRLEGGSRQRDRRHVRDRRRRPRRRPPDRLVRPRRRCRRRRRRPRRRKRLALPLLIGANVLWSLPPSSPSRRRRRRPPSSRRRSTRASPTTPASFGRRPSSVPAPWSRSRRSWRPR